MAARRNESAASTCSTVAPMSISLVTVVAIMASGFGLTFWMSDRLRFEERIALGVVVGVLVTTVVTFVMFELVGMGWAALGVGLAVPAIIAVLGVRRRGPALRHEVASASHRLRLRSANSRSLRPFVAFSAVSLAVTTRILSLSYQTTSSGLSVGSLAVWGDWSAHAAYAGSFAYGNNRALQLPTAAGAGFRYHFLVDFFGSIFTVSGATLQQSLAISAWMLALALPPLLWCAVMRLTRSRLTAALTLLLFVLSGGIGLWYFARDVSRGGWEIVSTLPQTYARMPDEHIWLDNTISASLYAQRSTLMGLCVGFSALILVLASRPAWSRRGFIAAGLLLGVMGIGHAHTMLTALALGTLAMIVDRRREWLWFLAPIVVIGLPLAYAISPQTNSIRWMLGWMAPQSDENWAWFWLRNAGLFLPLFAAVALFGGASRRLRRMTTPLWLWFIVPNLISFHPSELNNTKYFLFWQLGGCLLISSWLSRAFAARSSGWTATRRTVVQFAAVLSVLVMVSAGGLDTVRAMERTTAIPWVDTDDMAAARWLRAHTAADAVIVYGAHNTSAAAALGGRRAVSGYTGWTYDLGLPDWGTRFAAAATMLSGGPGTASAVARYGVDYVVIGPRERRDMGASDAYWDTHGDLVFRQGKYSIYRVS